MGGVWSRRNWAVESNGEITWRNYWSWGHFRDWKKHCNGNSRRVILEKTPSNGNKDHEVAISYNQARSQVWSLRHQPRLKIICLQFILSDGVLILAEYSLKRPERLHSATHGSRCRLPQPNIRRNPEMPA